MKRKPNLKEEICNSGFIGLSQEVYGENHREHLLKQYEIYVESLKHNSDLKQKVNSYFLTVNTLLLTATGVTFSQEINFIKNGGQLAIPIVGIIVCLIWWAIIYSYKQQRIVKNLIIQCVEKHLPLSLYQIEWEVLKNRHGRIRYYFFKISLLIPWVFILLYSFILYFSM